MEIKEKKQEKKLESYSNTDQTRIIKNVVVGCICLGGFMFLAKTIIKQFKSLEKEMTSKKYYELVLNNGEVIRDSMLYFNKRYFRDSITYPEASIQSIKVITNTNKKK